MGFLAPAIGSLVGGLLGGSVGGGDTPSRKEVALDEGTRKLVEEEKKRATMSPEELSARHMQGVDEAASGFAPGQAQIHQREQALGGDEAGLAGAINNKYEGIVKDEIGRMKNASLVSGMVEKGQRLNRAAQYQVAQKNVQAANFARLVEIETQAEAARSAVLKDLFGGAGRMLGYGLAEGKGRSESDSGSGGGSAFGGNGIGYSMQR